MHRLTDDVIGIILVHGQSIPSPISSSTVGYTALFTEYGIILRRANNALSVCTALSDFLLNLHLKQNKVRYLGIDRMQSLT